jgi:AraC-like DNA-binding protein
VSVSRPAGLRAGFHANESDPSSGLRHAGEQWAPARFLIKPHTHPVWELYLQSHGHSRWTAARRQFTLGPAQLLAVAPGVLHQMAEQSAAQHHFSFAAIDLNVVFQRHPTFRPRWEGLPPVVHLPDAHGLADPFAQLIHELVARRPYSRDGLCLAVDRLVLESSRVLGTEPSTPTLDSHPAVSRVRAILDGDCARAWTLTELGRRVGLAPTYLASLFTREVGQPPHRYLTERRVEQARRLLSESDLSITAISVEVGFGSPQHFARVFRRLVGRSPTQYHRLHRPRR